MKAATLSMNDGALPIRKVNSLVIGAGPSGLSAACRLAEAGIMPVIVEKSLFHGGLMRSISHGAFIVDLGRKELYTRIAEVDALWSDLLGQDYRPYPHRVGSLYDGRILEMSGRFRGMGRGMPPALLAQGGIDLARSWLRAPFGKPATYQDFWYRRAGGTFARALAQGYWEKFRGQRWNQLPVPDRLGDGRAVRSYSFGAIAHGLKLAAQGGAADQRQWRHPARGTGQICAALLDRLRRMGVELHFKAEVQAIEQDDDGIAGVVVVSDGERRRYRPRHVISSLSVEALAALLGHQDRLEAPPGPDRSVILVYLFLDEPPRFPHAWLEVNDPRLGCGRITSYAAFGGDMVPPGMTALCVEFFLDGDDPRLGWNDAAWTRRAIEECAANGLIDSARLVDTMKATLDRCNAAASWREAQDGLRRRLLDRVRGVRNLYHVNRPGTDWATFAGLAAASAIIADDRSTFDRRADPTRSYAASNTAEEAGLASGSTA